MQINNRYTMEPFLKKNHQKELITEIFFLNSLNSLQYLSKAENVIVFSDITCIFTHIVVLFSRVAPELLWYVLL